MSLRNTRPGSIDPHDSVIYLVSQLGLLSEKFFKLCSWVMSSHGNTVWHNLYHGAIRSNMAPWHSHQVMCWVLLICNSVQVGSMVHDFGHGFHGSSLEQMIWCNSSRLEDPICPSRIEWGTDRSIRSTLLDPTFDQVIYDFLRRKCKQGWGSLPWHEPCSSSWE